MIGNRAGGGMLLFAMACLMFTTGSAFGQFGQGNRPITRAQESIRVRIEADVARDTNVQFNNDAAEQSASNTETRVTGTGVATRNDGGRRIFYYDVLINRRTGDVANARYDWRGNWEGGRPGWQGGPGGPGRPGGNWSGDARQAARDAVQEQIQRDYGQQATVTFSSANLYNAPGNDQGVRGRGQMRSGRNRVNFDFDVLVDNRRGRVEQGQITFQDGRTSYIGGNRPGGGGWNRPGGNRPGGGWGANRPNGTVRFSGPVTNENSGKVLGVGADSREDGAIIVQWDYTRVDNQEWEVIEAGRNEFVFLNRNSNRVLEISDVNLNSNGANAQQYSWSGRNNQRWRLESVGSGLYRIVNVGSGMCLDVQEQSRNRGANVHQWRCGNERSQRWRIGN
ncbi:MAG: RICIN domain-containing protein [Acidobacteria bacterium]|nr:RICIN domain-containing protein [Acidobacteriota bacterium]MCW5968271.1 RICIN domain-containing protein [Blastocatellales bacterium]